MYSLSILASPAIKPDRKPGAEERFEIELMTNIFLNSELPTSILALSSEGRGVSK